MAIGDRIKEARIRAGLTQSEVGKMVGLGKSAISSYEGGSKSPTMNVICKLMSALHVDANYLLQDEMESVEMSMEETDLVKDYRSIDAHGKRLVKTVMKLEVERTNDKPDFRESRRERILRQLDYEEDQGGESEGSMSG